MTAKLKILVLWPIVPFPPDDGGKICSYSYVENLRPFYDFTVILPAFNKQQSMAIEEQRQKWPDVSLVPVELWSDQPASPKHFTKEMLKKIYRAPSDAYIYLKSLWGKKHFSGRSDEKIPRWVFDEPHLHNPFCLISPKYVDKVVKQVQEKTFDIIQIEYMWNLPIVTILPQNMKKLYVEIESRYSILEDYSKIDTRYSSEFKRMIVEHSKTIEKAYMERCDGIIALSRNDKERLEKLLPRKSIFYSPFCLLEERKVKLDKEKFSLSKLVFIGPEYHPPNKDAVEWFIGGVSDQLERMNMEFHVIGKWSEEFQRKFRHCSKIKFPGFVPDITTYIANSIHIVPVRLGGGGLRAKNLLCLSEGIPMVSTRLGCDGVDLVDGETVLFAEQPEEFLSQIKRLLGNREEAFRVARNSLEFYLENLSIRVAVDRRTSIYSKLLQE